MFRVLGIYNFDSDHNMTNNYAIELWYSSNISGISSHKWLFTFNCNLGALLVMNSCFCIFVMFSMAILVLEFPHQRYKITLDYLKLRHNKKVRTFVWDGPKMVSFSHLPEVKRHNFCCIPNKFSALLIFSIIFNNCTILNNHTAWNNRTGS